MSNDTKATPAPESPRPKGGPREKKSPPPPVIALRMETLLTWVVERVAKFPRDHKFTVGDRLIDTCLDITTALVEASYKRDKVHELAAASRALVRARVLVRLAAHLRCLSNEQHHHFVKESDEIGRMLGGWWKSAAK